MTLHCSQVLRLPLLLREEADWSLYAWICYQAWNHPWETMFAPCAQPPPPPPVCSRLYQGVLRSLFDIEKCIKEAGPTSPLVLVPAKYYRLFIGDIYLWNPLWAKSSNQSHILPFDDWVLIISQLILKIKIKFITIVLLIHSYILNWALSHRLKFDWVSHSATCSLARTRRLTRPTKLSVDLVVLYQISILPKQTKQTRRFGGVVITHPCYKAFRMFLRERRFESCRRRFLYSFFFHIFFICIFSSFYFFGACSLVFLANIWGQQVL